MTLLTMNELIGENLFTLDHEIFGVPVLDWIYVIGGSILLGSILLFLSRIITRHFRRLSEKTENVFDDLISQLLKKTKFSTLFVISFWAVLWSRQFPSHTTAFLNQLVVFMLLFQAGIWGGVAISWWVDNYQQERLKEDPGAVTTIRGVAMIAHVVLWVTIFLLALDNFGIDVTALVTGLGIGGIAVALAVQNILGDLFASLSIMLDKPFVIGDFLIIDDYKGTVEDIGLKTTRIRSLSGEQIIISNGDLLKSRIRNYKRMYERRVVFSIGVEYETKKEQLAQIPQLLKTIVESRSSVRFDRAHFASFGDFALLFEVVYYVEVPDYGLFMDIQQAINLDIVNTFEHENIGIAYPTQKLLLNMDTTSTPILK